MALRLLSLTKSFKNLNIGLRTAQSLVQSETNTPPVTNVIFSNSTRTSANFFNKLPAEHLWKSITSVSNAGRKRGRAKRVSKKNIKDLNRGQVIGVGKANILFPGLNAPIIRGKELVEQQQLPEDKDRERKLVEIRDTMGKYRYPKLSPIERGWSGAKMPGRSIGPPDPVGEDAFDGFDTKVLELKTVFNMKGNFGRKRRLSVLVVTGNKQGMVGFALGKGVESKTALRKAKNRAGQKLLHVDICDGHTVFHDFFTRFYNTKIYVSKKPEGYGLICHRAIKTICEVLGIKNLHAKVEGNTNVQFVVKAFFHGLLKQKTYSQIAEEKGLHLVEMRKENGYFPTVVGSPSVCRKPEEISPDEILDFKQYCLDGRVILQRKKFPPFYTKHKSWQLYLKKQEIIRNQDQVRRNLKTEYGELRSFLTDKYPECRPFKVPPKSKEENAEAEAE